MNLFVAPYSLRAQGTLNRYSVAHREGALLMWEQEGHPPAFADFCPLQEMGEATWREQLAQVLKDQPSERWRRSFDLAQWENDARKKGECLLENIHQIRNHFLITGTENITPEFFVSLLERGFRRVKVKIGRDPEQELKALEQWTSQTPSELLWRLDANLALSEESFSQWWNKASNSLRARIEFVEDPCVYSPESWSRLRKLEGLRLALDFAASPLKADINIFDVVVIKPALQSSEAIWTKLKNSAVEFVVTHSMDHPLGQLFARAEAAKLKAEAGKRLIDCGLLGADLFEPTVLSDRVQSKLAFAPRHPAFGLGVAEDLMDLKWERFT